MHEYECTKGYKYIYVYIVSAITSTPNEPNRPRAHLWANKRGCWRSEIVIVRIHSIKATQNANSQLLFSVGSILKRDFPFILPNSINAFLFIFSNYFVDE